MSAPLALITGAAGGTDTPLLRSPVGRGKISQRQLSETSAAYSLGASARPPEEIAQTIFFVATGPDYLHGSDIRVHGGMV